MELHMSIRCCVMVGLAGLLLGACSSDNGTTDAGGGPSRGGIDNDGGGATVDALSVDGAVDVPAPNPGMDAGVDGASTGIDAGVPAPGIDAGIDGAQPSSGMDAGSGEPEPGLDGGAGPAVDAGFGCCPTDYTLYQC